MGAKEKVKPPIFEGRRLNGESLFGNPEEELQKRLDLFETESAQRKLSELVLPEEKLVQIRALLTKIRYQQVLYDDFGLREVDPFGGRTAINLYGPPGTGKSLAAEAIAHELKMPMIRVNYAELESKFVGETAKNIRAAFQKAQESEALLFFDEADSILGRRLTQVRQSTDHAVNVSRSVMLLMLDRFKGVTVFATNLASNYDSAFVRRILGHIEFPMPNLEMRRELWRKLMPQKYPKQLSEKDWAQLALESEDLAGGDLLNVVINAAAAALERDGVDCEVGQEDFQAAIGAAKRAKAEVGREVESAA